MDEQHPTQKRAHRLADVAEEAGVSMATASRVLSNSDYGVKRDLRKRVLTAAEKLQYVPNAHARALARSSTSTVGAIVHDVGDPYFSEITRGIMRVADETGRLVMICHTDRLPEKELAYLRLLRAESVEAVVFAGSGFDDAVFADQVSDELAAYAASSLRLSVVGRHPLNAHAVVADLFDGAKQVAKALINRGHRRIGVILGPENLTATTDRMAGFREGLEDAGVHLPDEHIVAGDFTRQGGVQGARQLFERAPDLTAVFALNDLMAIGALRAIADLGRNVPEDVSVVGFDDIPGTLDTAPPLATVEIPLQELGERALRLAMDSDAPSVRTETLPATFVARESIGSAPSTRP